MTGKKPNPAPRLQDVTNVKSRDLIRGLLHKKVDNSTRAAFLRLMSSVQNADLRAIDRNLRENRLLSHLPLAEEFPLENPPFLQQPGFIPIPAPDARLEYVVMRAQEKSLEISQALRKFASLNQSIADGNDAGILAASNDILNSLGHSLTFARKIAFILGYLDKSTISWRSARQIFASYGAEARNYGAMALADSIAAEYGYLDLKRGFEGYASADLDVSTSRNLAHVSFEPILYNDEDFKSSLAINYGYSLIDAVLFILIHRSLDLVSHDTTFCPEVEDAWDGLQANEPDFSSYFKISNQFSDLHSFRASPAFLEYESFRQFRASLQQIFEEPSSRSRKVKVPNRFEEKFFEGVGTVRDVVPPESFAIDVLPRRFDTNSAGNLARSCALSKVAEIDPDFSKLNGSELGALMGATANIDRLITTQNLRIASSSATDKFARLILLTLVRAHSPATRDNYQFKDTLQNYIIEFHDGDIIKFLDYIFSIASEIVGYYVVLLDETLLSQLPFVVKTSEAVYEIRAQILEWHAEKTGDSQSGDKAKQLRIDRKIAAVRGQINETRLNIDSSRFRQWLDMNKLGDFSGFIRQEKVGDLPEVNPTDGKAFSEIRLTAHRDPTNRAIIALTECYREFCVNADFGVASYLGRRIRHGTLRGKLLDGLPEETEYDLAPTAIATYEHWREKFSHSINGLASKLNFTTKGGGKGAIISPEIDTKEKWEALKVCLIKIHEISQADQGVSSIALTVEQYCWLIFELELAKVREGIAEYRTGVDSLRLKYQPNDVSTITFERDVNISLSDSFNSVASWFNKPPNISPVAELSDIVDVVLDEAKTESPSYQPEVYFSGLDLKLSGSVYYHVYDALTIIVRNAAKHGARPGYLAIAAAEERMTSGTALRIEVSSEVRSDDKPLSAVVRMEKAGLRGAANADVEEGGTGVRKLKKMQLDRSLLEFEARPELSDNRVTVSITLPLSGIVI